MNTILVIFGFFFILATGLILAFKIKNRLRQRAKKKNAARKLAIQPEILFYLKKSVSTELETSKLVVKNRGSGKAKNIIVKDFHHPDEKDWCFRFSEINELDPDMEADVDAEFYVGDYKASNTADQLWMFDPDHDHDFAAIIKLSYEDIDNTPYSQTITIGENKQRQKINKLALIKDIMSKKNL